MPEPVANAFSGYGLHWNAATLWQQFDALVTEDAGALAAVDAAGRRWTRGDLHAQAVEWRRALANQGIGPGDRIMIEARKTITTMAAVLAISAIGAIACPYGDKLSDADCAALEARLGHRLRIAGRSGLSAGSAGGAGRAQDGEGSTGAGAAGAGTGAVAGPDGLHFVPPPPGSIRSDDPRNAETVLIGFTSGTTGIPKAVMHNAASLNYATRACAHIAGLQPGEPILAIVPWDSAPGFTFTVHFSLSLGHPLVIVDPWDAVVALDAAATHKCAWAICVPTHLFVLVEAGRTGAWRGRLSFRAIAVGGSAMTPELIMDADEWLGIRALRMFGMSECMGHASTRPGDSLDRRLHWDGQSFPGTDDRAFDPDLRMLGTDERGQAGVRGPSLFLGYCHDLGAGGEQMAPGGYLLTGDEIVRDADGFIKVVGRIKDQIIRGGMNIDPAEIEAMLQRMAPVLQAAVVPVPHAKLGEQVCAVCVLRAGESRPDLAAINRFLADQGLSKKKWPEHLVLVDALPTNANGKIDRKAVTAHAMLAVQPG